MTKINWTDATWNPVTGCTKISPGCKNCYAERMHKRLRAMGQAKYQHDFNDVHIHQEALCNIPGRKKDKLVFVPSMGDLFHKDVPDRFIEKIYLTMMNTPSKTFQVLTKRLERMVSVVKELAIKYSFFCGHNLDNIWHGGTFCNQDEIDKNMKYLLGIPGIKFASLEPMLGPIQIEPYFWTDEDAYNRGIDWVIAGCESGPGRRPTETQWLKDLKNQCVDAGVPFFLKQMDWSGKIVKMPGLDGKIWDQYPC